MLTSLPVIVQSLRDFPPMPEVVEDADTFQGNADKKAISAAKALAHYCIADDSGLVVDALGGAPGVYSARYAGPNATDEANVQKLLLSLRGSADRRARFRCALSLADPSGTVIERAEGVVEGEIIDAPRGDQGFGYDPVFVPLGLQQTMAELDPAQKNSLSHRGDALKKLWPRCVARFGGGR